MDIILYLEISKTNIHIKYYITECVNIEELISLVLDVLDW